MSSLSCSFLEILRNRPWAFIPISLCIFLIHGGLSADSDLNFSEKPECSMRIFVPNGCSDFEIPRDFYTYFVSNVSFLAGDAAGVDGSFCGVTDTWSEQDKGCIELEDQFKFSDHIECPRRNLIILNERATFVPSTIYRDGKFTGFSNGTTGLEVMCKAPYPLELEYNFNSNQIPFSGIVVKLGRDRVKNATSSPWHYWLKFDIPPQTTEHGRIEQYAGKFKVFSRNHPEILEELELQIQSTPLGWVYFGALIGIILITIIAILSLFKIYLRRRKRLTEAEYRECIDGHTTGDVETTGLSGNEKAMSLKYKKKYEISKDNFEIGSKKLGGGAYGFVWKCKVRNGKKKTAVWNENAVAKMITPEASKESIWDLLAELKIMMYLGEHKRIVTLLGANTENLRRNGQAYVFVELCPLGDLENHIKKYQDFFEQQRNEVPNDYALPPHPNKGPYGTQNPLLANWEMSEVDFARWAEQIAEGMAYLQAKNVIHGDLACQNVLLSAINQIKITGFGLSRRLPDKNGVYITRKPQQLRWRHMAIESLRTTERTFSSKSDVWSFGVTVWEIFTLCKTPYRDEGFLIWTNEFEMRLGAKASPLRLAPPTYGIENTNLYEVLTRCWSRLPEDRPDFAELQLEFQRLKEIYKSSQPATPVTTATAENNL